MRTLALAALALSLGCSTLAGGEDGPGGKADDPESLAPPEAPARIIWLIGDGMGVGQITAAAYASGARLEMLSMPEVAVVSTHAHEFVTTDSAAAATAMSSGAKTHFGGISVAPGTPGSEEEEESAHLETVVEVARAAGWRTGLVATTSVVDATPAAFAAHRTSRSSKEEIALDLRHSGVDVLFGGGSDYFDDRDDGQNLLSQLGDEGYSVARTATGLRRVAGRATRAVALLHPGDMPEVVSGARAMELSEMTEHALEILDRQNDRGFFLMVEGSWIDRKSHGLDGPATIAETLDFDAAVGVALDYARGRDDTLVLVTADHETGGLTVLDPPSSAPYVDALGGEEAAEARAAFSFSAAPPPIEHAPLGGGALAPASAVDDRLTTAYGYLSLASRPFFSGPGRFFFATHTATMVPLFAEGPAAPWVTEVRDNADLGARVKALVAADGVGSGTQEPVEPAAPENLILVVSDGTGLSALTAATYASGRPAAIGMPVVGLTSTHQEEALVASAPAAAAALAGAGLGAPLLARAEAAGRETALVSTSAVASLVPASFFTAGGGAARALVELGEASGADGIDLVFGGGEGDFDEALLDAWRARGVAIETSWSSGPLASDERVVRLLADGSLDPATERRASAEPSLGEMTEAALDRLGAGDGGFVLVVHAGGTGRALAGMDRGQGLLDELDDLDGAVRAALAFAAGRDDTAVVVASLRDTTLSLLDDHYGFHRGHCGVAARCGGPVVFPEIPAMPGTAPRTSGFDDEELQGDSAPIGVLLQYAWLPQEASFESGLPAPASANFVPLFAAGPGAEALGGFRSLGEVGAILGAWSAE